MKVLLDVLYTLVVLTTTATLLHSLSEKERVPHSPAKNDQEPSKSGDDAAVLRTARTSFEAR